MPCQSWGTREGTYQQFRLPDGERCRDLVVSIRDGKALCEERDECPEVPAAVTVDLPLGGSKARLPGFSGG